MPDIEVTSDSLIEAGGKYLDSSMTERLRAARARHHSGNAVLFDIIGSTARKQDQPDWQVHTEGLYAAFKAFCSEVGNASAPRCKPIVKFVGDGLLAFFPAGEGMPRADNASPDPAQSSKFVRDVSNFRDHVHEVLSDVLGHMRLKCVVAYLNMIALVGEPSPHDVLGRGIDFLFRLERFAASTHIVMNEALAKSCQQQVSWQSDGYKFIPCRRSIKGWEQSGPQKFYLLASADSIRADPPAPGLNDEHVTAELLKMLIDSTNAEGMAARPNWGSTPAPEEEGSAK